MSSPAAEDRPVRISPRTRPRTQQDTPPPASASEIVEAPEAPTPAENGHTSAAENPSPPSAPAPRSSSRKRRAAPSPPSDESPPIASRRAKPKKSSAKSSASSKKAKVAVETAEVKENGAPEDKPADESPPTASPRVKLNKSLAKSSASSKKAKVAVVSPEVEENGTTEDEAGDEESDNQETCGSDPAGDDGRKKRTVAAVKRSGVDDEDRDCHFLGEPVPLVEAKQRWPKRYQKRKAGRSCNSSAANDEDEEVMAKNHYLQAIVDGDTYSLNDNAYVKAADNEPNFIGRIVEFFEAIDGQLLFTTQWFYRTEDTVIKEQSTFDIARGIKHDKRRVFLSDDRNDNPLDCIVSKINIARVPSNIDLKAKEETIPPCDLYYDMTYSVEYTTFACLSEDNEQEQSGSSSVTSSDDNAKLTIKQKSNPSSGKIQEEYSLLDLYSGCGAMSTGLCLGVNLSGINLQTKWAVDMNKYACESLKLNHPKTEVRNEDAEDFLSLLKEWEKLCVRFNIIGEEKVPVEVPVDEDDDDGNTHANNKTKEFEVEKFVGICYGDPNKIQKKGLMFKVRWKGYGRSEDTWEPIDGLTNCQESIEDFVRNCYHRSTLPLPGDVDVLCGGPPCQGISGFNRFRNYEDPLKDPKNYQMKVYMDIVEFLKPRYVLMENVADILKFAKGMLGRYALSRLVYMNYQSRLGMLVAGCYGLPQFRIRVFLWGCLPTERLPQFPLPTHDVVVRGGFPNEFGHSMVAYAEGQDRQLEKALLLSDAISDLPKVSNYESNDEMAYGTTPRTEFQRFIRCSKNEMMGIPMSKGNRHDLLFDHKPLQLNEDDYQRVCQIPKKKGANFRNLPGVMVGANNVVEWDPSIERVYLPSGKPLVPDYAMSFIKGKSPKPFGRLWWDETVATVVTRAEPHNQIVLHPEQDRVLTIRENARLQGFPDFYQLRGLVKERYIQVGNAVAFPVSRSLGFALGMAFQGKALAEPLFVLPKKFPQHANGVFEAESEELIEGIQI